MNLNLDNVYIDTIQYTPEQIDKLNQILNPEKIDIHSKVQRKVLFNSDNQFLIFSTFDNNHEQPKLIGLNAFIKLFNEYKDNYIKSNDISIFDVHTKISYFNEEQRIKFCELSGLNGSIYENTNEILKVTYSNINKRLQYYIVDKTHFNLVNSIHVNSNDFLDLLEKHLKPEVDKELTLFNCYVRTDEFLADQIATFHKLTGKSISLFSSRYYVLMKVREDESSNIDTVFLDYNTNNNNDLEDLIYVSPNIFIELLSKYCLNNLNRYVKVNSDEALLFLLNEKYLEEWVEFDGCLQHKSGLNFYEWLNKKKLITKSSFDTVNELLKYDKDE